MKNYINKSFIVLLSLVTILSSCDQEQEVSPVIDAKAKPLATITRIDDLGGSPSEGDTLKFSITSNKMMENRVDFTVEFAETSEADADDVEVIGGTITPFTKSAELHVVLLSDDMPETSEKLVFEIGAFKVGQNWQLSPESKALTVDVEVTTNPDFSLVWSGTHEGQDMCEWHIDLDLFLGNADFSVSNFDGATGDCPLEDLSAAGMPDDTYDIYVDFWDGDIPAGDAVDIPYVVTISNNSGEPYTIEGTFNSDDAGASTHIVGQLVISNGVYTLYDADGTEMGKI